jgi:beta-lactamase regulating signal transducer with metallopeptidase domain
LLPLLTTLIPTRYSRPVVVAAARWASSVIVETRANAAPATAMRNLYPPSQSDLANAALLVWAIGCSFLILRLSVGLLQLSRISATSRPLDDQEWAQMTAQASKSGEIRLPARILRTSSRVSTPITWGVFRPRVLLPSSATSWSRHRCRVVLAHELAHVSRQDWPLQICAELVCCLYWLHPLAWLAARKLRQESEQACDDAVLSSGVKASDYAQELLDLVLALGVSGRKWSLALAIVRPSSLERRFTAMLSRSVNRSHLSGKARLVVATVAVCLVLPLAALRVPAETPSERSSLRGWFLAGDHTQNYLIGVDRESKYQGHPSAYLKAKPTATEGFGTLMQDFEAAQYVGKRVRFRASVKSEGVNNWAGMWMRVDIGKKAAAFDNMEDRPIKGTTGWHTYAIVLDVPEDATGIFFGILLNEGGTVWLNSVKFETVGTDVPVTDQRARNSPRVPGPTNLNFED